MTYWVAADETGGAQQCLDTVCAGLEQKTGNPVKKLSVDSNAEESFYSIGKDDIAVLIPNGMCLGTMISYDDNILKKGKCKQIIFAYAAPIMKGSKFNTQDKLSTQKLIVTRDGSNWSQRTYEWDGKYTPLEAADKIPGLSLVWADSCEALVDAILNGGLTGGTGGASTGGAQIKDKTFEDCIRRICAATDSVFMVENNAAIMFPYTDWMAFTLRQEVKEIKANMIDRELYEMEYTTQGFYNKVTTVYGAKEEEEDETSTTKKGKKKKEKKKNQNDEQTDTQKNGNVTKKRKKMPEGGTQLSQQYDPLVEKYGEIEKKVTTNFPNEETAQYVSNALLIQYVREFNNSCRFRMLNNQKLVGGTFYSIQDPFSKKTELYYLNSYTVMQKDESPITTDVDFKYGPEGAEEVMDYQHYSGTGGGGTTSTGSSATEQQIWADAAKVHYLRRDSRTCSDQNPEGAYNTIQPKIGQADCFADCYGMSSYLYYRFNNQAGVPCQVVGDSSHHVVMLFKNNAWYAPRTEYKQLEGMFGWKTHQNTNVLLAAPNNPSANPSGNTANQGGNTSGQSGNTGGTS